MRWKAGRLVSAAVLTALASAGAAARAQGTVTARALTGDGLLAGPVIATRATAVWTEAGARRLRLRAIGIDGGVSTLFSSSATPGLRRGARPVFDVPSISAAGGRVAFVRVIRQAVACQPTPRGCLLPPLRALPVRSATVLAGRPGAITPVETVTRPCGRLLPQAVAISDAGLVVAEAPDICSRSVRGRVVLRTLAGRLVRVLAREAPNLGVYSLVAAGPWAAFLHPVHHGDALRILDVRSGRTLVSLRRSYIGAVALDAEGYFALATSLSQHRNPCEPGTPVVFETIVGGRIGHLGLRTVTKRAEQTLLGVSGPNVAFARQRTGCPLRPHAVIAAPGQSPRAVPGLVPIGSLAAGGGLIATAGASSVQLARLPVKARAARLQARAARSRPRRPQTS